MIIVYAVEIAHHDMRRSYHWQVTQMMSRFFYPASTPAFRALKSAGPPQDGVASGKALSFAS